MTVIRPNSISGVTSITALANEINVFRHNGVLAGLQLNGVNHHTSAGVSTFHTVNVLGNLDVAGVLTYQDVTNVDSLGIGTFRTGINVSGGQLDVGSNIKLGNAGVITATSFVGSGANLTNLPAQATIANNADNRIITGGSGVNLNAESNVLYDGTNFGIGKSPSRTLDVQGKIRSSDSVCFGDNSSTPSEGAAIHRPAASTLAFVTNNTERFRITSDGDIYGPSAGRKNWLDNGSFDCTYGGRKANTSMDYGNHHAYGWVTDRFMSRNSVQWSRSTNVPSGKGFSYSTQTNGNAGSLMQAVELPDYGDMGVFTPNSYWCVSVWSTSTINTSASAFSYDLGSTKTDATIVHPTGTNTYASTGETAAGTTTGTFTRYYMVFQMPSSIISGATALYFTWFLNTAGYATGWQLERVPTATSKPTPYEHVHPSVTIARCRRYCYRVYNSRHVMGYKRHDNNINWEARHPVLPTHMPSGSNQSADPYGVHMHSAGILTNFQYSLQNPAVTALYRYGFNPADGSFILYGTSGWSSTHTFAPSYEGFEYEVGHGFF